MKQTNLRLVDGHKFGCHFLGYENDGLTSSHARYLIFLKQVGEYTHNQISRLAGLCRK
jgi:tRNA splicing endonuclease